MFKKFSHITLSVLLLVSTIGLAVSKHYCGDSFVSVSVFSEADNCCETGDCCHNESIFLQIDEDFSLPQYLTTPALAELELILSETGFESADICVRELSVYSDNHSPPPYNTQKQLSLNQSYLL